MNRREFLETTVAAIAGACVTGIQGVASAATTPGPLRVRVRSVRHRFQIEQLMADPEQLAHWPIRHAFLDYLVYGRGFLLHHLAFTRYIQCDRCDKFMPIGEAPALTVGLGALAGECPGCGIRAVFHVHDNHLPNGRRRGLLSRLEPVSVAGLLDLVPGPETLIWKIPDSVKQAIARGSPWSLAHCPWDIVQAAVRIQDFKLRHDRVDILDDKTLLFETLDGKPADSPVVAISALRRAESMKLAQYVYLTSAHVHAAVSAIDALCEEVVLTPAAEWNELKQKRDG